LPELPEARKNRFIESYGLPEYDAEILTSTKEIADYYEMILKETDNSKLASNWVMGDVLKIINEQKISILDFPVSAQNLGKLINLITSSKISSQIAKDVFPIMLEGNRDPNLIVEEKNLLQITDTSQIEKSVDYVLGSNPTQVEEYKSGKTKVLGFLVGQVMRETKGKANPQIVNDLLTKKLSS
jgi:aspartyl-tRNA(Asn)/glutamyl-tRNA(Gln) amidotransferase subunit B